MRLAERMAPCVDPLGRVSDKPNTIYKGITDNPHLFTGEAVLLLSFLEQPNFTDLADIALNLEECRVVPGLYSRHPNSFIQKYRVPFNTVSHDEYNGICFLACAHPDVFKCYAAYIVEYGQKNDWIYHDSAPNIKPVKYFLSNPIKFIKELIAYYEDLKNNPKNQNYIETLHPPQVTGLSKWRQPRDRAFYKLSAGIKPNIIEALWLALAITITSHSRINSLNRGGTVLMAFMRMLAIKKLTYCPKLVQLAHAYFNYRMKKRMGKDYATLLCRRYFNSVANHPMTSLVKRVVTKLKL